MSRHTRVVAEGVPHHITQRGNNRQDVFLLDEDRRFYIETLRAKSEQHGLTILGYCLMSNHVHLVALPTHAVSLARAGGQAHWRYSMRFNKQYGFNGLFNVDFQPSYTTSDGDPLLVRELDERLGLGKLIDEHLSDSRQGTNKKFPFLDLPRQSVDSHLAGDELDAAVVPPFPSQPGAATTERPGLQPGQRVAAAGAAAADQELVADEPAAAADENGRAAGQARLLLLAAVGRGTSEPQAVRPHPAQDLGAATAERVERSLASAKSGCRGVKLGGVSEKLPAHRRIVPFGERKGPVEALRSGPVRACGQERLAFKRE